MKIEIKKALLEGHLPEVIIEAVHANHPSLNKNIQNRPDFKENRDNLAGQLKSSRKVRDMARGEGDKYFANYYDNDARKISQKGDTHSNVMEQGNKSNLRLAKDMAKTPRIISSAKE